jgi:hypothetical protein
MVEPGDGQLELLDRLWAEVNYPAVENAHVGVEVTRQRTDECRGRLGWGVHVADQLGTARRSSSVSPLAWTGRHRRTQSSRDHRNSRWEPGGMVPITGMCIWSPHNRPSISRKSRCARRRDGRLRSCGERPLTVPRRHRSPHSVRLARGQRMVAAVVCHWARAADPLRVLLPRPQTPSAAILGVEDPRAQAAGNSRTPANSRPRAAAVATAARIQVPARLPLPRLPSLASVHRDVGDAWTVAKRLPGPLGHPLRRRNGLHPLDQREPRQVLRRDDVGVLPGLLSSSCV